MRKIVDKRIKRFNTIKTMKVTLSYYELNQFIEHQLNMPIVIAYHNETTISITYRKEGFIQTVDANVSLTVPSNNHISLSVSSNTPGVATIAKGALEFVADRAKAGSFLKVSESGVDVDLKVIPQLQSVLGMVALSGFKATNSGLILDLTVQ